MSKRPILFSASMVRSILNGSKTMTRRVVKPQPPTSYLKQFSMGADCAINGANTTNCHFALFGSHAATQAWENGKKCPYRVGDRLWVKESHYVFGHWEPVKGIKPRTRQGRQKWKFVPDSQEILFDAPPVFRKGRHKEDPQTSAWHRRSPLFMPQRAARITLEVVSVKVERLQDISEEDVLQEGAPKRHHLYSDCSGEGIVSWFCELWDSINGKTYPWESNPWVWVVEFKRVT